VGLGARVKLKHSRLVLRADVEDNSSPAKFGSADDPGAATASKGQHDFVVSMGLSIPL
jgi:hypothetical protein